MVEGAKNRVLLTAVGSMSAVSVVKSLKSQGHYVLASDLNKVEYLPCARLCDDFIQIPRADDPSYVERLLDACQKHKIEYVIPLTDPEVDTLNVHRAAFEAQGITVCISPSEAVTAVSYTHLTLPTNREV